jgi:hypothetical protein
VPVTVQAKEPQVKFIGADDKKIQYTRRIDFPAPKNPRFWSPGVYIKARFRGAFGEIMLNDEELWGNSHNYLEIAIDDKPPFRIQTSGKINRFRVAQGLPAGQHSITICKNTEAGIGYLEFVGFRCEDLLPLSKPKRKLERNWSSSAIQSPAARAAIFSERHAAQSAMRLRAPCGSERHAARANGMISTMLASAMARPQLAS